MSSCFLVSLYQIKQRSHANFAYCHRDSIVPKLWQSYSLYISLSMIVLVMMSHVTSLHISAENLLSLPEFQEGALFKRRICFTSWESSHHLSLRRCTCANCALFKRRRDNSGKLRCPWIKSSDEAPKFAVSLEEDTLIVWRLASRASPRRSSRVSRLIVGSWRSSRAARPSWNLHSAHLAHETLALHSVSSCL